MKKYFKLFIKVFVSGLLMYLIFKKEGLDFPSVMEQIRLMDLRYIPPVLLCIALNYFVSSVRWKKLLTVFENTEKITIRYLTSLYFIGSFFNNILPTSVGGDVYKIFKLSKKIGSGTNAFSATFMERFTGVLMLVLISFLSLFSTLGYLVLVVTLWFVMAVVIGFKMLLYITSKFKKLEKFHISFKIYGKSHKVLIYSFATSLIVQLLSITSQYLIFLAMGIKVSIPLAMAILPIITLATFVIPFSLNGLGVQDGLYEFFLTPLGVSGSLAIAASFVYHLARLVISLIGGVLYALGKDN